MYVCVCLKLKLVAQQRRDLNLSAQILNLEMFCEFTIHHALPPNVANVVVCANFDGVCLGGRCAAPMENCAIG